jgi:predicted DNA-binding transcriptional regulator YafY
MKDRILLEDIPSGQEYLSTIIEAMKKNYVIQITYQSYWRDESNTFNVEPYCIKLFKQRWYMLAWNPYYEQLMIYAVDRIYDIEVLKDQKFKMVDDFKASEFFENFYGIIANTDAEPFDIKLKLSASQANYLRSLPIHSTQKEIERSSEYSIFKMHLCPEFDFQMEVLSMGEDIEVLEPLWLREEIACKIKRMLNKYK